SGRYGGAFRAYVLWPLLVPITAGLLYPFVLRKQKEWNISHHHYGTTPFVFNAPTGEFYRLFLKALLFMLPLILGYVGVFASLAAGAGAGVPPEPPPAWASLLVLAGFFTAFFGITYVRAGL